MDKDNKKKLKKLFSQGIRFAIVGGMNTLIDMGVYFWLTMAAFFQKYYLAAQAVSYTCGVINSLVMNKRFTFREKGAMGGKRVLMFFAVNIVSLGVSMLVLYVFKSVLGWGDFMSKAASVVSSIGVNFTLNKLLVFKG